MIRLCDENYILPDFSITPDFIRIQMFTQCFDSGIFDLWQVTDGKSITALIFRMDGNIRFAGKSTDETDEFLRIIGGNMPTNFSVMKYYETELTPGYTEKVTHDDLREIYSLIYGEECTSRSFSAWYTDISHRMRHGFARGACIRQNGEIVSVALTVAESEAGAVIGGVTTHPDYRHRGLASLCVSKLAESLSIENKAVFVEVDENGPKELYKKLGFREVKI